MGSAIDGFERTIVRPVLGLALVVTAASLLAVYRRVPMRRWFTGVVGPADGPRALVIGGALALLLWTGSTWCRSWRWPSSWRPGSG